MILLQKKPNATISGSHQSINLIAHALKVILRVLTRRMEGKKNDFIGRNQFGFKKRCRKREAIGGSRAKGVLEFGNQLFVVYADFEKVFDGLNWVKLMEILRKTGVDWRD